jgi:acetolactate synthase-1/2/3 large subunit
MIKLSDYVIHRIVDEGVHHIFLLPGGGCMHLIESVGNCKEIEFVCNLHEQACAIGADSYGQYTNNLGVALVTTGPGGTNATTGVAAAWLESTPCLFISGQVKRPDIVGDRGIRQMGFQEINVVKIMEPITKYAITVMDPITIRYHIDKAIYLARTGRPGPVWIDIPLDVQSAQIDENSLVGYEPPVKINHMHQQELTSQVRQTIELLNQAKRPILLVGNGVRLAKALPEFYLLVQSLNIPVLTTWKAIDLFAEDDPLFIGRPGAIGQRGANFAQQNSDWFLSIGARLDQGQTAYNHKNYARAAQKIIVDIDKNEINKLEMFIDVPIAVDAGDFIREFLSQFYLVKKCDRSEWWNRCKEWKSRYPVILPEYRKSSIGVNTYALVDSISDYMTSDDILIPGVSGQCSEITMQAFKVKAGQRIYSSHGLGAMGFGIPASLAGCLASGRKKTICIDGDGGFHMNIQELETIQRLNLPVKFFVLNNQGYGSIRASQKNYFDGHFVASSFDSGLSLPDTLRVSAAYGIPTIKIENHDHLIERICQALKMPGPVVCDVLTPFDQPTLPRISSRQTANGQMVSMPMEDLFPFLDRDEFSRNMIIPPIQSDF